MIKFARTLALSLTIAAFAAALAQAILSGAGTNVWAQRKEHAVLDAASIAVRDAVAGRPRERVGAQLAAIHDTLQTWGITAAAFDRTGTFVAGDPRLRADGLPAGQPPAPRMGRQMAIVDTADGYVLLVPDADDINRSTLLAVAFASTSIVLITAAALPVALAWSRRRSRPLVVLSERLRGIAASDPGPHSVVATDRNFDDLIGSYNAAIARVTAFEQSSAAAEDRLRSFVAEAGHELRTPLAIAKGYVGLLQRGALLDAALAERIVSQIQFEHNRLQQLIERMLQLARLDALPSDGQTRTKVSEAVGDAVALTRPIDPARTMSVRVDEDLYARIAPDDLRDALRNLLDNALRYAAKGTITLTATLRDNMVRIVVADGGPGMEPFETEHAFDRFYRGSQRGETAGSGLGLSIVRRIAERAQGSVALESSPAHGTAVTLDIPLSER